MANVVRGSIIERSSTRGGTNSKNRENRRRTPKPATNAIVAVQKQARRPTSTITTMSSILWEEMDLKKLAILAISKKFGTDWLAIQVALEQALGEHSSYLSSPCIAPHKD